MSNYIAIGNSEPTPDDLPDEIKKIVNDGKKKAGFNPDGTPMTNPTDTNQASEDELDLRTWLKESGWLWHESHVVTPECLNDMQAAVQSAIRTEKLKLLDALEAKAQEYIVIGEQLRGFPYFITVDNIKAERNKLEAEL